MGQVSSYILILQPIRFLINLSWVFVKSTKHRLLTHSQNVLKFLWAPFEWSGYMYLYNTVVIAFAYAFGQAGFWLLLHCPHHTPNTTHHSNRLMTTFQAIANCQLPVGNGNVVVADVAVVAIFKFEQLPLHAHNKRVAIGGASGAKNSLTIEAFT